MNLLDAIKLAKLAAKDITNLKFESKDGITSVTGFSRAYQITAQAECGSSLNCTVDAQKILSAVQRFGDAITQDGNQLKLKQGRSRATIPTKSDTFPEPPCQSDDAVIVPGDIVNMVERVAFAAAKDDVRAMLNGVYIEIKDGKACAVATNGQRMAWMESDIDSNAEVSFIIGQSSISPLIAVAPSEIEIGYIARGIGAEAEIFIVPIDGKYVNWRAVIPPSENFMHANRESMLDALQNIAVVSNDKSQNGVISFGKEEIALSSQLKDGSEAEAVIDAVAPVDATIGINIRYLSDCINAMKSEEIEIGYTDISGRELDKKDGAIYFSDGELNVIVMPVVM